MAIAEIAYKIMERKKMKQAAVAEAAGYTAKEFNNLLRGRKRIQEDDIIRMCRALECQPNELFGYPTQKTKNAS